jgi:hypothetical protein
MATFESVDLLRILISFSSCRQKFEFDLSDIYLPLKLKTILPELRKLLCARHRIANAGAIARDDVLHNDSAPSGLLNE